MPLACFLNATTDSHDSDIGHCLGMTPSGRAESPAPTKKDHRQSVSPLHFSLPRSIIIIY